MISRHTQQHQHAAWERGDALEGPEEEDPQPPRGAGGAAAGRGGGRAAQERCVQREGGGVPQV